MSEKKMKFIIKPMEPKETRFLADRTQDRKKVKMGDSEYTIIPLSPVLRQRLYNEADKRERAKKPIMQSFGWDSKKTTDYLNSHSKPFIKRSAEEQAMITRFLRDDGIARKNAVFEADEGLAFEILDDCVVLIDGKKPGEVSLEWEQVYEIIGHIEDHSLVDYEDRLAL